MIRVEGLSFSYPRTEDILREISFTLEGGHTLALLGNNGAGKSTLLKCLDRILEPRQGLVELDGRDIRSMRRRDVARSMAYVAQHNEGGQLTVFDAVLLGRRPYIRVDPTEEDLRITREALERMELEPLALRSTDELSGGELQKVVLARALAQQPEVLLLDEPTSNLDLYNQHEVMRLVSSIARSDGIAVLVVIHDLNLALRYCDRFLFVHRGRVRCFGDVSVVTEELLSEVYGVKARVLELEGRRLVAVE